MIIENYGLLTYLVHSETTAGVNYLVDLSFYRGNGKCDCPFFRINFAPMLELGGVAVKKDDLRCKHIRAVRRKLAEELLERVIHNALHKPHLKNATCRTPEV